MRASIPILEPPIRDWYCPNCGFTDRTKQMRPAWPAVDSRFHTCPRLRMLQAPLLEVGVAAKVEAKDREDYVKEELVQMDSDGRPIMSVLTTRDEGQDAIVFAPTATLRGD